MSKEREYVFAEQVFSINVIELKSDNNYYPLDKVQLNHIPLQGNYYIPKGKKNIYKIVMVIHNHLETMIVISDTNESIFNDGLN